MTLQIVQDEAADEVLSTYPFALLCGMILQQQVPVDVAFAGPAKLLDRLGTLDPAAIAETPADEFAELCAAAPSIHQYPESMSVLIQAAARYVVAHYGGQPASMWQTAGSAEDLLARLMLVPGFNKRKAQMFIALLGKQLGVRPEGWEPIAGPYAEPDSFRSVADVRDAESLLRVRDAKATRRKAAGQGTAVNKTSDSRSATDKESRGVHDMTIDDVSEEAGEEPTEQRGRRRQGKKAAAKKAAKRAANKERRRLEDEADPEAAARRAEKRAARREAAAAGDGDGDGNGRRGKGKGRGRKRAEAGAASETAASPPSDEADVKSTS